jgi:hypothetical protein
MESKEEKVRHVKSQGQTRPHHCHWPGCDKQIPPAKWGCFYHWMKLPKRLRIKIWDTYRIGQERDMRPSREYLQVAREVQEWIKSMIMLEQQKRIITDEEDC